MHTSGMDIPNANEKRIVALEGMKLSIADVTYTLLKDNEKKKTQEILLILDGLGLLQSHLILKFCMETAQETAVVSTTH